MIRHDLRVLLGLSDDGDGAFHPGMVNADIGYGAGLGGRIAECCAGGRSPESNRLLLWVVTV